MVTPFGPVEAALGERSPSAGELVDIDPELAESLRALSRRLELGGQQPLALEGLEERDTEMVVARPRRLQLGADPRLPERARRPAGRDHGERFDRGRDLG